MLPGVDISSLPDFNKGDLLAVCVPGNPAPIAVGAAVMNSMTAKEQVRPSSVLWCAMLCYAVLCWAAVAAGMNSMTAQGQVGKSSLCCVDS